MIVKGQKVLSPDYATCNTFSIGFLTLGQAFTPTRRLHPANTLLDATNGQRLHSRADACIGKLDYLKVR